MRRKRTKQIEIVVRARLIPGTDDDLIDWLDELPEGDASQIIRDTLRAGLNRASIDPTAQQLKALFTELNVINRKLDQGVTVGNGASVPDVLGGDEAEARRQRLAKAKW